MYLFQIENEIHTVKINRTRTKEKKRNNNRKYLT